MSTQTIPVLHGTYTPPAVRRGDRIDCLYRDCTVLVKSWSDAPIPWPRGCRLGTAPGHPGVIVDEELARAVRQESAAAISYWWGVSTVTVIKWRKALGTNRKNNDGSQALIRAATTKARAAVDPVLSPERRQKHRASAVSVPRSNTPVRSVRDHMRVWRFRILSGRIRIS